jgi:hypothetical protein
MTKKLISLSSMKEQTDNDLAPLHVLKMAVSCPKVHNQPKGHQTGNRLAPSAKGNAELSLELSALLAMHTLTRRVPLEIVQRPLSDQYGILVSQ